MDNIRKIKMIVTVVEVMKLVICGLFCYSAYFMGATGFQEIIHVIGVVSSILLFFFANFVLKECEEFTKELKGGI